MEDKQYSVVVDNEGYNICMCVTYAIKNKCFIFISCHFNDIKVGRQVTLIRQLVLFFSCCALFRVCQRRK